LKFPKRLKPGFPIICLTPSLFGILVFFGIPFLVVVYFAFIRSQTDNSFAYLDNFKTVLENRAFRRAAINTAVFSATAVPLAVVSSLALALGITNRIRFASGFQGFFLTPMMVPVASVVLIWQVLFHDNGVINTWLSLHDFAPIAWFSSKYSQVMIVLLFIWKNLGYNMILFMAAIVAIPGDLVEVATLDCKNKLRIFFQIKLRFLTPAILFVTIMSLINSFKVFREVYLLTTDYPYDSLYMLQHFMNNTFRNLDYQKLSAAAVTMFAVMIIIIGILFFVESLFDKDTQTL